MQSRLIVNLLLLLAVIGLASFVLLQADKPSSSTKLSAIDRTAITKITIPREQGDIVMIKQQQKWLMQSPYQITAHEFRVNRLLDLVDTPVTKQYNTKDLNLIHYGLQPSRASIVFNDLRLDYGKANPVTQQRYILSDNKLNLIQDELYPLIRSQAASFVDLSLLTRASKIVKLSLPDFTVFRHENKWQTSQGQAVETDRIHQLLQNWQSAQAFGIHNYMTRKQLGKVSIQLDNNQRLEFEITDNTPWLILARPDLGIEYHLDGSQIKQLLQLPVIPIEQEQSPPDA